MVDSNAGIEDSRTGTGDTRMPNTLDIEKIREMK